ncbi:MAG: PSD1 and planctomycete cytochrome C domain-containing protein [Planctomycetota bacterium]|jgi:hypothetical protein|nr:PSD1 and planctomycete cytochrome C domain-containing protein [Planctomycetota bacterium]
MASLPRILPISLLLSSSVFLAPTLPAQQAPIDYARDVAPILEKHCYDCHGKYSQKAGLRLDQRAAALAGSSFGQDPVLLEGDREGSLLWQLLVAEDPEERMPPKDKDAMTDAEIKLVGDWIEGGMAWHDDGEEATWPVKHWAYQRVRPEAPPAVEDFPEQWQDWPRNEVDRYLLAKMLERGLPPQDQADRGVLLRRAALDLTGLPPTVEELDAFLADTSGNAWANAIAKLMASPHYGEQQAQRWLDLARYADSNGYEKDEDRSIWPYRDWVIDAYNNDMGYDQFTIEQIAGDLLPEATQSSLVATGFHRNTMINNEGGTDDEEYRVAAVKDRTDTTATVWLGSTLACAQCHNHKYDPFTQRDYYQLYDYFNQTVDGGKSNAPEMAVRVPHIEQERAAIAKELQALQGGHPTDGADFLWVDRAVPEGANQDGDWTITTDDRGVNIRARAATGFQQHHFSGASVPVTILPGDRFLFQIWMDPDAMPRELFLQFHEAGGDWEHRAYLGEDLHHWGEAGTASRKPIGELPAGGSWQRIEVNPEDVGLPVGSRVDGLAFGQFDGNVEWGPAGLVSRNPNPLAPLPADLEARLKRVNRKSTTMVMRAIDQPRTTHLLEKGSFLTPGYEVQPGVPEVLRGRRRPNPSNRLELAQWLINKRNPVAARVEVNRVWQQVFGTGLSATVDDLGSQGEIPTHPQLLDWLALEFMKNGWSRKWLLATLMDSAAYRQSAVASDSAVENDPANRYYSHFPRLRLNGENLRDLSLAVSGLLVPELGGPSVFPPQPAGIDAGTYAGDRWRTSTGPDRYRRGIYTFWRRTSPYPSFAMFDATSRETLCARRDRSNTPLQALVLMNDPAYTEMTQAFAERLANMKVSNEDRITYGFRSCTGRVPAADEIAVFTRLLDQDGWESVARVMLNLDDTMNRG